MVKDKSESCNIENQTFTKWNEGFGVDNHTDKIGMLDQDLRRNLLSEVTIPGASWYKDRTTVVETLLSDPASRIGGTYAAQASARRINVENLKAEISGNVDL